MRSLRTSLVVGVLLLGASRVPRGPHLSRMHPPTSLRAASTSSRTTALDTARWNTIVRPNAAGYSVSGGQLKLRALTGDMYGDRATAQNLILQDVPNGAWTATTKLDSKAFTREGQQAGLHRLQGRFDLQQVHRHQQGHAGPLVRAHLHGRQGRPARDRHRHHAAAGRLFPALVSIRVISDGQTIRGEYSGDGITWAPIGRPAKIGSGVKLGLYAADNAQDGPEVPFEFVSLNAQSDEFSGTELEKCRWSHIEREAASGYRVANGALEIDTGADEVDGTAPNLIGQPVPGGAWQAETKIDLTTTLEGQQAGLLLYKEPATGSRSCSSTRAPRARSSSCASRTAATSSTRPSMSTSRHADELLPADALQRRAATAQYSTNGTTWTDVGKSRDISDLGAGYLGPMALRGERRHPGTAKFDYVRVAPSPVVPCTANGTPESGLRAPVERHRPGRHDAGRPGRIRHRQRRHRRLPPGEPGRPRPALVQHQDLRQLRPARAVQDRRRHGQLRHLRPLPEPGHEPADRDRLRATRSRSARASPATARTRRPGSIYNTKRETARAAKPAGQWNDYEIRYEDGRLHDHAQRHGREHVHEHDRDARADRGLHRPAEPQHGRRGLLPQRPHPAADGGPTTNLFTTVGITTNANRANGQIYPPTNPYSLPAEQMPPSGTVGVRPERRVRRRPAADARHDRHRSRTSPRCAARCSRCAPPTRRRTRSCTSSGRPADGGPAGGNFTLRYSDDTTADGQRAVPGLVRQRPPPPRTTRSASSTAATGRTARVTARAVASTTSRSTTRSRPRRSSRSRCRRARRARQRQHAGLPDGADARGDRRRSTRCRDLSGQVAFPDDNNAPTTTATFDPAAPNGNDGWYTGAVARHARRRRTRQAAPASSRSCTGSTAARRRATPARSTTRPRASTRSSSARSTAPATPRPTSRSTLKVDANAPTTTAARHAGHPARRGRLVRQRGHGAAERRRRRRLRHRRERPQYRLDGAATGRPTTDAVAGRDGRRARRRVPLADAAGNVEADKTLSSRSTRPRRRRALRINGAAPVADYTGPVRVAFTRNDGDEARARSRPSTGVDGGEWTATTTDAFDVSANRGHKVDFRSIDLVGNVENFKRVLFTIRPPATLPAPRCCRRRRPRRRRRRSRRSRTGGLEGSARSPRCAAGSSRST